MENICDINTSIKLDQLTFCKFKLSFYHKEMLLTFPQLLQLKQKLNNLTSPLALQSIIETDNFVLLAIADGQHLLFLEIANLLDFNESVNSFFSVSV